MIDIYFSNSLTKKKEKFIPVKEGEVGIYSCGPTVYWNQHIGHMYAYVQWDVLVRFLKSLGLKVKWVMNITDVGHMTGENEGNPDIGEDKMEKGAKREGVSVWNLADKYIAQFEDSMKLLNIVSPDKMPRATKHIPEQIELAKRIEKNGFTYLTNKGLVYDTAKFPKYADFGSLSLDKQIKGKDVEDDKDKKLPWDFFLWALNQSHIMKWESPWGVGYPGWHLECTAMSVCYLGENFDIHTGGVEHIAVHHTNEIAQGYGAFGKQTANYWLHNAHLTGGGGEKMSKSKGNFITAQELVQKGYDPLSLRYLILSSHYKKGLNFSFEALDASSNALTKLRDTIQGLKETKRNTISSEKLDKVDKYRSQFFLALADDLNIPNAVAVLWQMLKSNIPSGDKYDLVGEFDQVLGLKLLEYQKPKVNFSIPKEIETLLALRKSLRNEGKYTEADGVRVEIEKKGFKILDTPEGSTIKPI